MLVSLSDETIVYYETGSIELITNFLSSKKKEQ